MRRCQLRPRSVASAQSWHLRTPGHAMGLQIRDVGREDAAGLAAVHVAAWMPADRGLIADAFLDGTHVQEWKARRSERLSEDELPPVRVATGTQTRVSPRSPRSTSAPTRGARVSARHSCKTRSSISPSTAWSKRTKPWARRCGGCVSISRPWTDGKGGSASRMRVRDWMRV